MSTKEKKFWPMNQQQSFIAAAVFLVVLFLLLFSIAVGKEILCWINKNAGLATWIQGIGSIFVIYAMYYQTSKDIIERRFERKLNEKKDFLKMIVFLRRSGVTSAIDNFLENADRNKKRAFSRGDEPELAYPNLFYFWSLRLSFENLYKCILKITENDFDKFSSVELISITEAINQINYLLNYFSNHTTYIKAFMIDKSNDLLSPEELSIYNGLENRFAGLLNNLEFHMGNLKAVSEKIIFSNEEFFKIK